jgi:hypothetical protein
MTTDRHFHEVLAELDPYLDNLPNPGSAEEIRFDALIAEVAHHAAVGPDHPFADQIDQLTGKIEAVTRRRDAERHAHDVAPGRQNMPPMLGGDL